MKKKSENQEETISVGDIFKFKGDSTYYLIIRILHAHSLTGSLITRDFSSLAIIAISEKTVLYGWHLRAMRSNVSLHCFDYSKGLVKLSVANLDKKVTYQVEKEGFSIYDVSDKNLAKRWHFFYL